MRRLEFLGSALVALLLCAPVAAPPASAEVERRRDARHDAPAAIDVWAVRYVHARTHVRVVAHVPDLGRAGSAALSISRFEIFEAGHVVRVVKRAGQPAWVRLFYFDHFDLRPRRCPAMSASWGEDAVRLRVARRCLADDAQQRVFVQFGIQRGPAVDRAPAVRRLRRG